MSILRSGLKLFGGRSATLLVGFVAITVFARELGVAVLGAFFLFQAVLSVVTLCTDLGLRGAVVKRISEGRPPGEVLSTAAVLQLLLFLPIAAVLLTFGGPVAAFVGADVVGLLLLTAVLQAGGRLTDVVLQGELHIGRAATVELLQKVVYAVVGVWLVLAGFGIRGPIYGLLAGYAAMLLAGVAGMDARPRRPSAGTARSLVRYARFNAVNRIGGVGYSWIDVVVIGLFLSNAHVGAYEVAWKVAALVMVFGDALSTAAFPKLSEYAGNGELDRIEAAFPRLVTLSLAVVVPALFGTLALSREILGIAFGPEYVLAAVALVALMANNLSSGFYRIVARTLQALDRPDMDARSVVASLALNVVFNLALVPRFGLLGAAVGTSTASLLGNLLALEYLDRLLDVRFRWAVLAWCVVAAAVMAVLVGAVRDAVGVETAAELLAVVAVGVVTYVSLLAAVPSVRALVRDAVSTGRRSDSAGD